MKKVVIIYGAPGSGKGTQANELAKVLDLEHFDTGKIIEKKVFDPKSKDDPIIQREKKNFENGDLCTPEWVSNEIVKKTVRKFNQDGKGIVFSGSPRTLPEARELIPILENLYNKENIYILRLNVKPETSIFRNSNRRVCSKCGHALVYNDENKKLNKCPKCGGELVKRVLDKIETIKVRLEEFKKRTEPIYSFLEGLGYKIIDIDGDNPSVKEVSQDILKSLGDI
ncbi:adenylate kinase family protein [Patescibacteria group bacterium]